MGLIESDYNNSAGGSMILLAVVGYVFLLFLSAPTAQTLVLPSVFAILSVVFGYGVRKHHKWSVLGARALVAVIVATNLLNGNLIGVALAGYVFYLTVRAEYDD